MSVLMYKKIQIASAAEGTYGTAASLTSDNVTDRLINPVLKIARPVIARQTPEALGQQNNVPTGATTDFTFSLRPNGSGTGSTAPDWAAKYLVTCGLLDTAGVYNLTDDTSNWKGLSVQQFRDGRKTIGRGMVGTFDATFEAGQPVLMDFTYMGGWEAEPTEASKYADVTYNNNQPPIWGGTGACTIDGTAVKAKTAKLSLGNALYKREDPNSKGGYIGGWFGDRVPKLTIDPEASALATFDFAALHAAGTTFDVILLAGTVSGHKIKFTLNDVQLDQQPEDTDRDGKFVDALTGTVTGDIQVEFP